MISPADAYAVVDAQLTTEASADSAPPERSIAEVVQQYVAATRQRTQRCRPGPVESAYYTELEGDLLESLGAVGVTREAQSAFARCASDLETAGCGAEPESCAADVGGSLAESSPCLLDAQCQSGRCLGAQVQSCGACGPARTAGIDCGDGTGCGPGLECANAAQSTQGAQCFARTISELGASCTEGRVCRAGLRCNATTSRCEELSPPGGSCASGKSCDQAGAFYCDTTSVCVARPRTGDPCANVTCAAGLVCDRSSKRCRGPRKDVGLQASCETGDACVQGLACSRVAAGSTSARQCLALAPVNADCTRALCGSNLVCEGLQQGAPRCVSRLTPDSCLR